MSNLSEGLQTASGLARYFALGLEAVKELQKHSPAEASALMDALACHLRSASPMSFSAPPLLPTDDALIDIGAGQIVRLRVIDGRLNMYVVESPIRDVAVTLSETARVQLRAALEVVR